MRAYRLWIVIILVVAVLSSWMSLSDPHINFLGMNRKVQVVQGLDLQGGSRVLLQVSPGTKYDSDTVEQAVKNVERRVNGLGVTEAVVQRQGDDRIIVELPGVREQAVAFDSIKSTGLLEFVDFSTVTADLPEGACILTTEQVKLTLARSVVASFTGIINPVKLAGLPVGLVTPACDLVCRVAAGVITAIQTYATWDVPLGEEPPLIPFQNYIYFPNIRR